MYFLLIGDGVGCRLSDVSCGLWVVGF